MNARTVVALAGVGASAALLAAGCGGGSHRSVPGASVSHGKQLVEYYGCGACHQISNITPQGKVGPSLVGYSSNRQIAGTLPNTTANLIRWIERPQQIAPHTTMPNLGIGPNGARDIAAYLYAH